MNWLYMRIQLFACSILIESTNNRMENETSATVKTELCPFNRDAEQ